MATNQAQFGDEKQLSSEEKAVGLEISNEDARAAQHSPEYAEYLELSAAFEGKRAKKLLRKVDWHVLPQLIIIYLLSYVDRSNVGNAKLFGAVKDLHMSANDWNIGLSIFFITYALGGPLSNMVLKRFGPKKVMPGLLFCVSVILVGSGCANNRAQWFALRMLLGLFEAGIFPGGSYILTTWYTPDEIQSRSTIFYVGAPIAHATSSLLASAIGKADGVWGYSGFRWLYVLEGEVPEKQGKWLKDDERRYIVLRNKFSYGRDKSGNSNEYNLRDLLKAVKSWQVWMLGFSFFSNGAAVYGLSFTVPTMMKNMGFTAVKAQAMSAPPYLFAAICVLVTGYLGDKYKKRMLTVIIPAIVAFIGTLIAILTVQHKNLIPLTYIGVSLSAGGTNPFSPIITAWMALNTAGQTKRAAAISIIVVCVQVGGILGSNIYLDSQAPGYPLGFGCSLAFLGFGCVLVPIFYWYLLKRENYRRSLIPEEEIYAKYTAKELEDMGDLSPLYRYEY